MLRSPARAVLLLTLAVAVPAAAQAPKFDLEKTRTVLTGLIEKAIRERGVPSISIALVRGDSIVWKAAFGYANVRMKVPATPETIYSTGSTFKSATATGLLQMMEQKKLDLDVPVNQYLGDKIQVQDRLQSEKAVTTRHILSHWSGLTSGAVTKPLWGRELPKTLEQMVSGLYSVRAPEAKWEYNNFAFGLAGLMLEKISGTEYEKYMLENVLKPLGINTPHPVYPSADMVELMALPYAPGGADGKPTPVEQVHFDVYPAGDIYLTAEDMARFLGMHLNGGIFRGKRIISEASAKLAHEPPFGGTYAFGWMVSKDSASGHTIIQHSGGIPGQSSNMMGDLDAKVGVYYMSNSGAPGNIATAAIKLLRGEDYVAPAERKAISVDPKILDRYVGTYVIAAGANLFITREGDHLVARTAAGGPAMTLLAESTTSFFIKGQDEATVVFVAGPTGAIEKLRFGSTEAIKSK